MWYLLKRSKSVQIFHCASAICSLTLLLLVKCRGYAYSFFLIMQYRKNSWECFNFFGWHQMSDWLEANFLSFILYFWKVTKYFLKKSAPYVENWVISRIKFADDKKVGVLEYHTLAFCASLRTNNDKIMIMIGSNDKKCAWIPHSRLLCLSSKK